MDDDAPRGPDYAIYCSYMHAMYGWMEMLRRLSCAFLGHISTNNSTQLTEIS